MDYIEATQAIPLSDYEDETDDESQEHDGQSKKIVSPQPRFLHPFHHYNQCEIAMAI